MKHKLAGMFSKRTNVQGATTQQPRNKNFDGFLALGRKPFKPNRCDMLPEQLATEEAKDAARRREMLKDDETKTTTADDSSSTYSQPAGTPVAGPSSSAAHPSVSPTSSMADPNLEAVNYSPVNEEIDSAYSSGRGKDADSTAPSTPPDAGDLKTALEGISELMRQVSLDTTIETGLNTVEQETPTASTELDKKADDESHAGEPKKVKAMRTKIMVGPKESIGKILKREKRDDKVRMWEPKHPMAAK